MFQARIYQKDPAETAAVTALYTRAFPARERWPLQHVLGDAPWKDCHVLTFYDDDQFCGFTYFVTVGHLTHILYLAVDETLRERGYGTLALAAIRDANPGRRVVADLEKPSFWARNNDQRRRRKEFYLRNGYVTTQIGYRWHRERYEIMSLGGDGPLTDAEYNVFWEALEAVGMG